MTELLIEGAVAKPIRWTFDEIDALPGAILDVSALSAARVGRAQPLSRLLHAAEPNSGARFAELKSADGGFSAILPISALEQTLVIYALDEGPLPTDKGGPYRVFIAESVDCGEGPLDACKNVKNLGCVRILIDEVEV